MKRILLALAVFLCGSVAHANTYTAASCSAADFQTAINLTVSGDTVNGPGGGGSASWSATGAVTLTSSHEITLNGNGCVITLSGSSNYCFGNNAATVFTINMGTSGTHTTTVTGFTFNGGVSSGTSPIAVNTSYSPLSDYARFYNLTLGPTGTMFAICGNGPVLFDHNTLATTAGNSEVIHVMGEGNGTNTSWSEDVVPGGTRCPVFENNSLTFTGSVSGTLVEHFYGACATWRYNTLNGIGLDVHGTAPGTCGYTNGRWVEIYNNTFLSSTGPVFQYINMSGGSGIIYSNTHTGSNGSSGQVNFQSDCGTGSYPLMQQVGRGINNPTSQTTNQAANVVYYYSNTGMSNITKDVNGSYIQIGTAPTDATNCSANPGNACDVSNQSTPSSWLRCESAADITAGCPVTYTYAAAAYPHPLDNCPTGTIGVAVCGGGSVTLLPSSLGFGNVPTLGTGATQVVTLSNTSGSTITFSSLGQTGSYSDFPYTTTCASFSGGTLTTGNTCTLSITFKPTGASGTGESSTFTLNYTGAAGSPLSVLLSGNSAGVAAVAQVHIDTGGVRIR